MITAKYVLVVGSLDEVKSLERSKNFALIIKSSLFEGIFKDAKGVNCASLEIVRAKK